MPGSRPGPGLRCWAIRARHTLAEFSLYTGRTHQIRVHMWWLGYPLAGDDIYGWRF